MIKVGVIVVTWNGLDHLKTCLGALAEQTFKDFAVTVVDNASSDATATWLKNQSVLKVHLVELKSNTGFTGGNIAGLATFNPRPKYVVLLNNDTYPEREWLAQLVAAAEGDARRGAVASLIVDWTGKFVDSAGDGIRPTGRGYQRLHGFPVDQAAQSQCVFSACAGAALYRSAMLNEVGFLDSRFFMNGEDTDLAFRGRLAGWSVWFCADARVRHRVSASQRQGSHKSVFYNHRNHLLCVVKCMPAPLILKYIGLHIKDQILRGVYYSTQGRFFAWSLGVLAGLCESPLLLRERLRIQRGRRITAGDLEAFFVRKSYGVRLSG